MRKFCLLFLLLALKGFACTGIQLQAADGSFVNGRTLEFGIPLDLHVAFVPRGVLTEGKTPLGKGLTYRSKYAAVGMYCFNHPVLMDGMNEKGLTAGAFYFPGFASYTQVTKENQARAISPAEFPHWILTQFATIEEIKNALPLIVIAPTILESWGPVSPPFHYIVYDKSGKSIVIEPLNETLVVHDNELGVVTNSPTFDWHLTNLRNFIHLTPFNLHPLDFKGLTLAPFGQGSGMVGLPGDFTPPSRFVRAAFFAASMVPPQHSEKAVYQLFHLLNQFDIPFGAAREKIKDTTFIDYTMMTSVKEPQTLRYYYKSYEDQSIKFIDLTTFSPNLKTIQSCTAAGEQKALDFSSALQSMK